jgi:hypothetical protein
VGGSQASQPAELKALKADAAAEAHQFSQVPNLDDAAGYSRQASFFFALIVSLVRENAFLGEKAVDSISPLW